MRNAARIKLGYYPLPQEEGKRLRGLLEFSAGTTSVVDPCVGTGAALHQLTGGAEAQKHGVELDANRAAAAAASGIATMQNAHLRMGGLSIAGIQGALTPGFPYMWIATLAMGTTPI